MYIVRKTADQKNKKANAIDTVHCTKQVIMASWKSWFSNAVQKEDQNVEEETPKHTNTQKDEPSEKELQFERKIKEKEDRIRQLRRELWNCEEEKRSLKRRLDYMERKEKIRKIEDEKVRNIETIKKIIQEQVKDAMASH